MPNNFINSSLKFLAYLSILMLFAGFLFNKPVNNIGLTLAGFHALIYVKESWAKLKGPVLYVLLALILLPTVHDIIFNGLSFFHVQNTLKWSLIVYPLFFVSCMRYPDFFKHTIVIFSLFIFFGSVISLVEYFNNYEDINQEYGMAKVMKVPAFSDHIRYSWAIVVSMIFALYAYMNFNIGKFRFLWIIYIIFNFLFLFVLSSKTGLITLYLTTLVLIGGYIFTMDRHKAFLITGSIIMIPVIAYFVFPSFQNRIEFIKYDYYHFVRKEYKQGQSDALRMYSLEGGVELIGRHPVKGFGFSEIQKEMNQWYSINKPFLKKSDYFLPSSEIVLYWASCGIFGLIVILSFVFVPLWEYRKNVFFLAYFIPVVFSFLYETHLETQTGIFVFGFTFGLVFTLAWAEKNGVKWSQNKGSIVNLPNK
ncbi:MAG: O-antigen ligase family protein [Saprospiraceae bacterium]|nr:O-antigen ligase family protein [Saprospiraceae bacterium]